MTKALKFKDNFAKDVVHVVRQDHPVQTNSLLSEKIHVLISVFGQDQKRVLLLRHKQTVNGSFC